MKILAAFLLAALVSGCGDAPPPPKADKKPVEQKVESKAPEAPKPDPDRELARRVKRVLENEAKIQAAGIDVTAKDGAVTLWGTAASVEEMRRAAQAAAKVDGVKSVDNRLQVVRGS
jgi:osmotically-inducible protein OsmY